MNSKSFSFNFDWHENFQYKIELIIKINESLAENKIKNETEQLLLEYNHGNNIHKHRKQQNE